MVIKTTEEEVVVKAEETPKDEEKKEGEEAKAEDKAEGKADDKADGEDGEANKDKKVLRKFIRAYYPKFKGKVDDKKRIFYETFFDLKGGVQQAKSDAVIPTSKDDDGASKAELKEENDLVITSDCDLMILALIIKGLKGEQHKVIMFNPEKKGPLS